MDGLPFFGPAAIEAALPWPCMVEALREGFRHGAEAPVRHHHRIPRPGAEGPADLLIMPAWRPGAVTGMKIVHVAPGNEAKGLASIQGLYLLFDGPTGTPKAVLDGAALTLRRTAGASALAASYLARDDVRVHLVVGAGALCPNFILAHRSVRPSLQEALIWNRHPAKAEAVAARLRGDGLHAEAVQDLPSAVRRADLISAATNSTVPLIRADDVRPGTHVDLVGAYTRTMRESDDVLVAAASVFVDTREGALAEAGDLLQAIEAGAFQAGAIRGDLRELARGDVQGRRSAQEITLFKSVGAALEDLVAAEAVLAQATN
ncbi:MAG TPA: ornithine cyclodeaminase family protein [Geminicoccus sp.]|jgi:ornithine cyclodeaminase|uniref:ornithine cyclodeaminase family protein n=1 Tax=Geminicoccus sp. TaxID=2024832 RepID=UPI002E31D50B|nr:ornithine cyclodeaminase family protein [Geminicoccus sp.]HEX2525655.1 ornithine cyclodeaminase family protein [Geminicoccus sp.]